jgi:hypothetical protein
MDCDNVGLGKQLVHSFNISGVWHLLDPLVVGKGIITHNIAHKIDNLLHSALTYSASANDTNLAIK